jgi:hypothetical protein
MMHVMTRITTRVMIRVVTLHHDAEHVWILKGEFRSKKSKNSFFDLIRQDSHALFKPNYKAKQAA